MKKLSESIWSDMQDRSSGDTVRREDKFINQMNYDEFFKYNDIEKCKDIINTYITKNILCQK